ncbi:MAG TPA: patatin-like phospholipase family protein [Actinomycetota bacterium]
MGGSSVGRIGFVLGGGGHLGAYEVGMLRALLERDLTPDVVVGTSVGALNGAAIAASPTTDMVDRLDAVWRGLAHDPVFGSSLLASAATLMRTRTAIYSNAGLKRLIRSILPVERFEDLRVRFECVASSVERASERWFHAGPLEPAILASAAIPGLLPAVEIDGEHFFDGGLVNSIPLQRAVALGATEVYVLHVGRIEQPLSRPRNLMEVAVVSFEIARRHRFARDLADVPDDVTVHVLPTGERPVVTRAQRARMRRYRGVADVGDRIERAHLATRRYLARHAV